MKQDFMRFLMIISGLAIVLLLSSSVFIVDQRQYAVLFQFGKEVKVISEPGLKLKAPFIQNVRYFDKRLLTIEVEARELTAADGKRIIVDAFASYVIKDPVNFYRTVHDYQGIKVRLNKVLEGGIRKVIGRLQLSDLLSTERGKIMMQIREIINEDAADFGIFVEDVRIKRADLPQENSAAIYKRMQTEREKEAKQIRAEGYEEATKIRSSADKERQILLADAYLKMQIIKGEAEAEAARVYNAAYEANPEFYKFYRHLEVYKKAFTKEKTTFIFSPESKLLKYLDLNNR